MAIDLALFDGNSLLIYEDVNLLARLFAGSHEVKIEAQDSTSNFRVSGFNEIILEGQGNILSIEQSGFNFIVSGSNVLSIDSNGILSNLSTSSNLIILNASVINQSAGDYGIQVKRGNNEGNDLDDAYLVWSDEDDGNGNILGWFRAKVGMIDSGLLVEQSLEQGDGISIISLVPEKELMPRKQISVRVDGTTIGFDTNGDLTLIAPLPDFLHIKQAIYVFNDDYTADDLWILNQSDMQHENLYKDYLLILNKTVLVRDDITSNPSIARDYAPVNENGTLGYKFHFDIPKGSILIILYWTPD